MPRIINEVKLSVISAVKGPRPWWFRISQKPNLCIILFYYENTNEIPGELLHENLISSRVKITCDLQMWKYHLCYGYIINHAFHTKKLLKWNGLVFHWCLYNKKNITWPLGDTKFLFSCWKNISLVHCAHSWNIFFAQFGNQALQSIPTD